MKNQLDNKSHEYIKLYEKLDELAGHYRADPDLLVTMYENNRTTRDGKPRHPSSLWGILAKLPFLEGHVTKRDMDYMMSILKKMHEQNEKDIAFKQQKPRGKTKKLSHKKTEDQDMPEWIKKAREDLISTNFEGHVEIEWELLEAKVRAAFVFKTMDETREVYYYRNGVYLPAKTTIEAWLKEVLGVYADWRLVQKVENWIRYSTYTKRAEFDSDKKYIPLTNGLLNIETEELEEFDSEKLFTSGLPVEYDPEASTEPIKQFMSEVLYTEDIPAMQELYGYCLFLGYPSAKLFWLNGSGRNGKSTVISLLRAMLGEENVSGVGLHEMDGSHRFSLATLFGCRLNDMAEAETQKVIQTPTLKRATGGDLLHAEKKGIQKRFKYVNYAKCVVSANEVPMINDNSLAIQERLFVIDFPHSFTGVNDKPHYVEEFIAKNGVAGIFNWAFEGLKRLYNNGWSFTSSEWQIKAKADMMTQAHPVTSFLEDWTEFSTGGVIGKNRLYEAYENYCEERKIILLDENAFIKEVRQQNHIKLVRNQRIKGRPTQWRGIRFKPYIEDSILRNLTEEALDIDLDTSKRDTEDIGNSQGVLKI